MSHPLHAAFAKWRDRKRPIDLHHDEDGLPILADTLATA